MRYLFLILPGLMVVPTMAQNTPQGPSPVQFRTYETPTNTTKLPAALTEQQEISPEPVPLLPVLYEKETNTTSMLPDTFAKQQEASPGSSQLQIGMAKEVSNATSQVQSEESVAPVDQAKSAQISFLMDAGAQYTDEGEYAEAERAYLRALENSPDNPAICFHLSTLYIQMGRFADAAKLLKELTEKFPDNPMVQNNLSWIYASSETMKNGKLALLHAREALLSAPAAPSVWNTLAEAYYVSGQYDQALQASKQALELLRLQKTSETELAAFEAQSAKIQRAAEAYKKLMGLDNQE